jgi:hypothetical protein
MFGEKLNDFHVSMDFAELGKIVARHLGYEVTDDTAWLFKIFEEEGKPIFHVVAREYEILEDS